MLHGIRSSIEGGIAIISNTIEAALDHSRVWDIKDIDRTYAAVFMTGRGDLGKSGEAICLCACSKHRHVKSDICLSVGFFQ